MKILNKYILLILTLIMILGVRILKSEIPTIPIEYYFKTNITGFPQMKSNENKLFLLYKLPETFWAGENNYSLDYYEDGKWNNLLGREDSISIYDFDIDKSGNVWVASGRGLFKYDWVKWEKFVVEDSLKNVRDFTNICIDSNNNIWCTTFCGIPIERDKSHIYYSATYSEILRFKGNKFEMIKLRNGGLLGDNLGGLNGIICLPDGRVLIHDALFPISEIDNIKNDLLIYDGINETKTTIQAPHFKIQSMPKQISKIYPDKTGNVWFCLSGSGYEEYDPGLTMLKSDGSWQSLNYENGFSYWDKFPDIDISYYLPTYCIYQDNFGKYWVGGDRFFGYLDSELKLRIPNNSFYSNCTLTTATWKGSSKADSTISTYFYNISRYREIDISQNFWWGRVERITGTKNGDLWFGTNIGLLHYSPGTTNVNSGEKKDEQFAVYPNPIQNNEKFINLVLYGNNKDLVNAKLYSVTGQLVSESQVSFWGDLGKFPLPQNLTTGSYFIEIQSNNTTYTEKIIIN